MMSFYNGFCNLCPHIPHWPAYMYWALTNIDSNPNILFHVLATLTLKCGFQEAWLFKQMILELYYVSNLEILRFDFDTCLTTEAEATDATESLRKTKCKFCGKKFAKTDGVLKHVKKAHKYEYANIYESGKTDTYCTN